MTTEQRIARENWIKINKEVNYMFVQLKNGNASEEFKYWLNEKIKLRDQLAKQFP